MSITTFGCSTREAPPRPSPGPRASPGPMALPRLWPHPSIMKSPSWVAWLIIRRCRMDALLRRRAMIAAGGGSPTPPEPVLPEGYTALEYIENPLGNSAYIDTGIIPNNNIGFEIDWMSYDDIGSSNYGCIMGSRYASNTNDFQISSYTGTPGWSGTLRLGGNGQNYNAVLPAKNTRFSASLKSGVYKCGTTVTNTTASLTTSSYTITVFSLRMAYTPSNQNGHGRLYGLKLYDGTTLTAHYVPCINPSLNVGVYDLVSGTFKGSSNSTPFVAGPEII